MNLYVGTSGFGYKEWRGKFYPRDMKADEMLRFHDGGRNRQQCNYHSPQYGAKRARLPPGPAIFRFI